MHLKNILTFFLLIFFNSMLFAQNDSSILNHHVTTFQKYANSYPTEKVYLHMDKPCYSLGDTIWFKAYIVQGLHKPSEISKVLYAELIDDKDSLLKRITLQVSSSISWGDFTLSINYRPGIYRLRAYTNWMRNESSDYFYDRKFIVKGIGDSIFNYPITHPANQHLIKDDPFINKAEDLNIQFFPESGYLVNGLRSRVVFKANDKNGLPVTISGVVLDESNNKVAAFNTKNFGIGEFVITPQLGKIYKAKILSSTGITFYADLPSVKEEGFILTINNRNPDSIYIKISANNLLYKKMFGTSFYLVGQSSGEVFYTSAAKLSNAVFSTRVSKNRFPTGIVQFTLLSQNGEPLNDRIIFVQNNDLLKLKLSAEKENYLSGEKIKISLEAKNNVDQAIVGSYSVSVTDETNVLIDEVDGNTILTDFLLTSDLRDCVANYYFENPDFKTNPDLDLLMLTQSKIRLDWVKTLNTELLKPTYQPETLLTLSGFVKTISNKAVPAEKIRLSSIKDFFVTDTLTDLNGRFVFNNIDLYDSTKIILSAKKPNGNNNLKILLTEHTYPVITKSKGMLSYLNEKVALKQVAINTDTTGKELSGVDLKYKSIQLKEVKIKGAKNTYFNSVFDANIQSSTNLNGPGNADEVILAENILVGGSLADALPAKTTGLVRWQNGVPYLGDPHKPMAIVVDGAWVNPDDLKGISVDITYSIEVLRHAAFTSIYGSTGSYGILVITLRRGVRKFNIGSEVVNGLITHVFNGYYKAHMFYSPNKYVKDSGAQTNKYPKTIYWDPNLITDGDGKKSFEYYNGGKGNYRVVVEGIDGDGNLGRIVYRYKVE